MAERKGLTNADQRLQRLLVMVPWVSQEEGPDVERVCERFNITEAELAGDLELLFMCGLYPFTPDVLMEADIVDGRVWIRFTEAFVRPPTFTRNEAVSLLAAAAAVVDLPGNENVPLRSALSKLVGALGLGDEGVIDVDLAPAPESVLALLQQASREQRWVEVDYYSYGRDAWTRRSLAPYRVFNAEGQWYVQAGGEGSAPRTFRVDRMANLTPTERSFEPPADLADPATFTPRAEDPLVTLDLTPRAHWVIEQYPTEAVEPAAHGGRRVTLRVSEPAWLERLLLRLGPDATVVSGTVEPFTHRILRRYPEESS